MVDSLDDEEIDGFGPVPVAQRMPWSHSTHGLLLPIGRSGMASPK